MSSRTGRTAALVTAVLLAGVLVPLTGLPAGATPPGVDGDLVLAAHGTGPVRGIYTLNPNDVSPALATVEEGNSPGDIGPAWSPAGRLAMSLPDLANGERPRVFTGTRTYKTDGTSLAPVVTTHDADTDPAWSPDGSRLAFVGSTTGPGPARIAYEHGTDLWTMRTDGSDPRKVVTAARAPSWSPDGTALLFTQVSGGIAQLAASTPDGANVHLLSTGQAADHGSWSPDGTKVAFDSATLPGDSTGHRQIAVLDVTGGAVTQLTTDAARDLYFPSWSPDGTRLAFEALDAGSGDATIQTVALAGGAAIDVTSGHDPSFSPDGSTLAFTATSGNGSFDLFTVPAAGGTRVQVTNSPHDEWAPTWSLDGSALLYVSDENGNGEVWSRHVTGPATPTALTATTVGSDGAPAWSPALVSTDTRLFTADADGTDVAVVTLPLVGGDPTWSPDGSRLAFSDAGHLYTIQPDGLGLTAVTTSFTGTTDSDPSWSPDGSMLAFSGASSNGDAAIYTIHPSDGTGLTKVVGTAGDHDSSPVWSPQGSRIAFIDDGDVYTVDADGGGLRLVKGLTPTLTAESLDWGSTGPPDTLIDTGPHGTLGSHDATFTFSSTRSPATFECMLEATVSDPSYSWSACGSGSAGSKTYGGLGTGTYTFRVRATTSSGTDQTPASSQFTVAPPDVVVTLAGDGGGSVTSSPAGIGCSPSSTQCIHSFDGPVTLTAKADGLSTFTGWSQDCTGTGSCQVEAVTGNKHVTATFAVSGNGPPPCTGTSSTQAVGLWSVKGCFSSTTSGFSAFATTYSTNQLVELNGLKVYPTDTTLTFDPVAGTLTSPPGGRVTLLAGPSTVSGHQVGPVPLSVGPLSLNLKAVSISLTAPAGTSLLGMPIGGSVALSTPAAGTVRVDLQVLLPAVLGSGSATAHLLSTAAGGLQLSSLAVGPVDAALAGMFRVKGASFSYDATSGWAGHGTIQVPGGLGTFDATFGYAAGVLQKADLSLTKVSVAGFLDASSFQLHYLAGTWSASAVVNGGNSITGSLTFQGSTLKALHLQSPHVSAFGLVSITGLAIDYDEATGWAATGQLAGNASFTGGMGYTAGVLTQADLHVAALKVGGAFGLTGLDLSYDSDGTRDHWHGGAALDSGPAVTADFALTGGVLSSAALDASHVSLLGVLDVGQFHLGYNAPGAAACVTSATTFGLSGSVAVPGAAAFALSAGLGFDKTGLAECGHLRLDKARLNGVVDVNRLALDVLPGNTWSGAADVQFPGGLAFGANISFVNGVLTQLGGTITVPGTGLPLGASGVFVKGGSFQLQTTPSWQVTGGLQLTGGPTIPVLNVAAIGLNGQLQLRFPSALQPPGLRVSGQLQLAGLTVSEAYVDYTAPLNVDVAGCLGTCAGGISLGNGLATVKAAVTGKIRGTSAFQVTGDAETSLHFAGCVVWCIDKTVGISGSVIASNIGVAACGHINGMSDDWAAGVGYTWGGTPKAFSGCSLTGYQSIPSGAALRQGFAAQVTGATSLSVPAGLPVQAFRFTGVDAPPFLTLTGPQGETISARNDTAGVADGHLVMLDPATDETIVLVDHPSAGTWTATPQEDSAPLASTEQAAGLPAPVVAGTITGSGLSRTLTWTLEPHPGQVVRFVENGPDSSRELGTTSAATGSAVFAPSPGAGGTRTIVAEVVQDGLPRAALEIATYVAPSRALLTVTKHGLGRVTSTSGIVCGLVCSADVRPGRLVGLTATPERGMRFAGWGGLCAGSAPTCTVAPTESSAVVATFDPLPAPTVTAVTPAAAKPGSVVTITGTQLTGTTRIGFGPVLSGSVTVVSPTTVTAVVPSGALTGKVSVGSPSGVAVSSAALKVLPVISSLAPTSVLTGARLDINGAALTSATVTVGGWPAKVVATSWARVSVLVPAGTRGGRVVVTTSGGQATSTSTLRVLGCPRSLACGT